MARARDLSILASLALGCALAVPAHAQDPVIAAAGDISCDPADPGFNSGLGTVSPAPGRCHQKYTSDRILALAPDHVLTLGDLQYEDGAPTKWSQSYDPAWGRVKSITRPAPGNHEYGSAGSNFDPNATGYFGYFSAQLAPFGSAASDPKRGWYSFDVPVGGTQWHVVALNSECAAGLATQVGWSGGCAPGSQQEAWLRADLAADSSDCTLAYWHHPRFSSGKVGDNPIMAPIWDALYEDYADVVLNGHDHNYERMAPQGRTGAREPGRGIHQWVIGTGGKSLRVQGTPKPASEVTDNTTFGVLRLTLHGPSAAHPRGWYEWGFLGDGNSGSFTDQGAGDCVGPHAGHGGGAGAAAAAPDRVAPAIRRPRLSRRRFRVGPRPTARVAARRLGRGTTIVYTLSEKATVRLAVHRRVRRRGALRHRRAGTLVRSSLAGRRRVRFTGRIGARPLRPGRYRLTIWAKDAAGNSARPRRLFFTVVR